MHASHTDRHIASFALKGFSADIRLQGRWKVHASAFTLFSAFINEEAKKDILPLFRGRIWAALLDITQEQVARFYDIDVDTVTTTDHQISVCFLLH
jgi:hypothetical protein